MTTTPISKAARNSNKLPGQPKTAPAPAPAAIGETAPADTAPVENEVAENLPEVEDTPQQPELEKKETAPEAKKDGRGRPKNMLFTFQMTIGEALKAAPELRGMVHVLSEKRKRSGEEIQALIAAEIAANGIAALTNPEFLGSLAEEEIGERAKLGEMEKNRGAEFPVTITRGAVKQYFADKEAGVFLRLTKAASPETPTAPGEDAKAPEMAEGAGE